MIKQKCDEWCFKKYDWEKWCVDRYIENDWSVEWLRNVMNGRCDVWEMIVKCDEWLLFGDREMWRVLNVVL